MSEHGPLLRRVSGEEIRGLKMCAKCGLSETYWERWSNCPYKGTVSAAQPADGALREATARLDEAKWWEHLAGEKHDEELASECMYCQRITELERTVRALAAQTQEKTDGRL